MQVAMNAAGEKLYLVNGAWVSTPPASAPLPQSSGAVTLGTPKPVKPKVQQVGGSLGIVGDDGSFTPTYTAPDKSDKPDGPPSGYRFSASGNLEPIPGGPADPDKNKAPKPLSETGMKKLETGVGIYGTFKDSLNSFQDDFAGNVFGSLENKAQGVIGSVGTQGQRNWWSRFQAMDNAVRNDLFGATLTPSEQASYLATTVSPELDPKILKQNLATRAEILRKALARQSKTYKANNINPDAVDAALGEYQGDIYSVTPTSGEEGNLTAFSKGMNDIVGNRRLSPEARLEAAMAFARANNRGVDPEEVKEAIAAGRGNVVEDPDFVPPDMEAAQARADQVGPAGAQDLLIQGATFGLSDEAAGIGSAAANLITSPFTDKPLDIGGAYTTGRDAERIRLDAARQRMGGAGTALEIGGGLLGGNVSNALRIAPTLGGRIGQGARAGAVGGGIAGFGYGEGVNSLGTAAGGAAAGAALGGLIPVAGQVISNRVGGMRRLLGRDPALPRRIVNEAIEADGNTPASVGARMDEAAARGSPMMMADTGENAQNLLASMARQPGASRTIARGALQPRQEAQAERINAAVVRDLGPTANMDEMSEELINRARTASRPFYEAYEAAPGASSVKLDDLAMRDGFRAGLQKAAKIAAEEGEDATSLGFQFNDAGEVVLERVPSFKTLDYIKQGMDDVVEAYRNKTTGKLELDRYGGAVNNTLRTLIKRIDDINPDYAKARAAYEGPAKMKTAMLKGRKALSKSPDDILAMTKRMGDGERESFQLGLRKAIIELVNNKKDGGDKVAALIGTPNSRRALSQVFGGRREFDRFIATLRDEEAMGQTYRAAYGNSTTAKNLAQDAQSNDTGLAETAVGAALRGGKDGVWSALVSGLQKLREVDRFGAGEAGERTRESIAALLSETDPVVLRELVAAARQAARQQGIKTRRQSRGAARVGRVVGVQTGNALGSTSSTPRR